MDYAIIGGDARLGYLARLLSERGLSVGTYGRENQPGMLPMERVALAQAKNIVVNCPPKVVGDDASLEAILDMVNPLARVFLCGPKHPEILDERLIDLWSDEGLLSENAILTAEGAVASTMRASTRALRGAQCLVIGWGRIGRALTELLVALGADVTVASRSQGSRNRVVERGAKAANTALIAESLPGKAIIFNTAPSLVLDDAALRHVDRDAMLIDLASPPYGIDLHAAWSLGLRAWREPGLPGRYCPWSAAQALMNAIERRGFRKGRG